MFLRRVMLIVLVLVLVVGMSAFPGGLAVANEQNLAEHSIETDSYIDNLSSDNENGLSQNSLFMLSEIETASEPNFQFFAGKSRQETAAQIALEAYPSGAYGVIIANGEGVGKTGKFADALAASSLAGLLDYPILLTAPGTLPSYTAAALKKLNPQRLIILGDTKSISQKVVSALKANNSGAGEPIRLQGVNRIETAVKIYGYGARNGTWGKTAIFADASNFPDALAIAPYAGYSKFPIFLVQGNSLDDSVTAVLERDGFSNGIIVGSEKSVSNGIAAQIKSITGKDAIRLAGANRYKTASQIASYSISQGLNYDNAGIATGENFPDALTGGPLLAKRGAVMLLAADNDTSVVNLLANKSGVSKIHIFGGDGSVSKKVCNAAAKNLGWDYTDDSTSNNNNGSNSGSVENSTVYITNNGKKYHLGSCSSLSKSKIAIARSTAIARGYTPCANCKPG